MASINTDGSESGYPITTNPAGVSSDPTGGPPLTDRSEGAAGSVSSGRGDGRGVRDDCLGRVCVGAGVRGDRERAHWMSVMETPRKVVSHWQTLH